MGKGHASPSDGNAYATNPRQMEFCRKAGPGIMCIGQPCIGQRTNEMTDIYEYGSVSRLIMRVVQSCIGQPCGAIAAHVIDIYGHYSKLQADIQWHVDSVHSPCTYVWLESDIFIPGATLIL